MESEEIHELKIIDTAVIEAQNRAEIDVQIATAKQYPRNMTLAKENAIVIVTMDEETAKSCNYTVPRGGKSVSGPSVHLAKILMQQWGNLRAHAKVVSIDDKHITSQAFCHDLESNIAVGIEVKRSIMGKRGRFKDDMITVTGNASNSIALRNAILSVVPKGVVDAVYTASKAKVLGDITDEAKFLKKRSLVFAGFNDKYAVSEERVLKILNLNTINQITPDHLIELIGIAQALKDGDTTVEEVFPLSVKDDPGKFQEDATERIRKMKEKGKENDTK